MCSHSDAHSRAAKATPACARAQPLPRVAVAAGARGGAGRLDARPRADHRGHHRLWHGCAAAAAPLRAAPRNSAHFAQQERNSVLKVLTVDAVYFLYLQRCCAAAGSTARLCVPAKLTEKRCLACPLQHGGCQLRGRPRRHQQAGRALRDALLLPQVAGGLPPGPPRRSPPAREAALTGRAARPGLNKTLLCTHSWPPCGRLPAPLSSAPVRAQRRRHPCRRPGARAATGASQPASCTTATPTRSARATCSSRAPRRTGRRPRSWPATWTR